MAGHDLRGVAGLDVGPTAAAQALPPVGSVVEREEAQHEHVVQRQVDYQSIGAHTPDDLPSQAPEESHSPRPSIVRGDHSIVIVKLQPSQKKVTARNTLRSPIKGGIIEIHAIAIQTHNDDSMAGVLCPVGQFPSA